MKKEFIVLKEVEILLQNLYGNQESLEKYLEIYRKLLNLKEGKDRLNFYVSLNESLKKDDNIELIESVYKYVPWFKNNIKDCVNYSIKNNMEFLAKELIIYANEKDQMKIIETFISDYESLNCCTNFISKKNAISISKKLISQDCLEKIIQFTLNFEVNVGDVINYIVRKIKNNDINNFENFELIMSLFCLESASLDNLEEIIVQNYESKFIYEFLLNTTFVSSNTILYLKILLKDENLNYFTEVIKKKSFLIEEKELEYIISTKNISALLITYKYLNMYPTKLVNFKNNIFKIILESNDLKIINQVISNEDFYFLSKENRVLYEDFLIRNNYYKEIANLFITNGLSSKFKIFKYFVNNNQINILYEEIDNANVNNLYNFYENLLELLDNLESDSMYENLILQKYILVTLHMVSIKLFSIDSNVEDMDKYVSAFYNELEQNKKIHERNNNPVEKIRKIFRSPNN